MIVDKKMINMKTEILDSPSALVKVTELCLVACSLCAHGGRCHCWDIEYFCSVWNVVQ